MPDSRDYDPQNNSQIPIDAFADSTRPCASDDHAELLKDLMTSASTSNPDSRLSKYKRENERLNAIPWGRCFVTTGELAKITGVALRTVERKCERFRTEVFPPKKGTTLIPDDSSRQDIYDPFSRPWMGYPGPNKTNRYWYRLSIIEPYITK